MEMATGRADGGPYREFMDDPELGRRAYGRQVRTSFSVRPKTRRFRCYMKDPDGYLIEVGQTKAEAFVMKESA